MNKHLSKEQLQVLPKKIRDYILKTLHCSNTVELWYENGKYHAIRESCIKILSNEDSEYIGTFFQNEIIPEEEIEKQDEKKRQYNWEQLNSQIQTYSDEEPTLKYDKKSLFAKIKENKK